MGQVFKTILILIILLIMGKMIWSEDSDVAEKGRKMFIENRCYTCHTINAESVEIEKEKEEFAKEKGVEIKEEEEEDENNEAKKGGDLSHVGAERDSEWIKNFSKKPKEYFKDDPNCRRLAKKKYRKRFKGTDEDHEILVAYLSTLKYKEQQEEDYKSCLKE
ncbi:c-type cytochrome [Desulfobacterota bacterium AH_259_B03_O07]|nr:c-type cytochrome [Desulfobacterota bacterium AH_259_B03_O07]